MMTSLLQSIIDNEKISNKALLFCGLLTYKRDK